MLFAARYWHNLYRILITIFFMEKNLQSKEAHEKFKSLVDDITVCMFITNNEGDSQKHTRPMATVEVDEKSTLWFFTDIRSIKVEEVNEEHTVHLVYAHPGKEIYLDVWGNATVSTDKKLMKEKWTPVVKVWFPNGVDDPNLALLKVQPRSVYYWDSESGKMISILKIAASIVSGKQLVEGEEGKLSV